MTPQCVTDGSCNYLFLIQMVFPLRGCEIPTRAMNVDFALTVAYCAGERVLTEYELMRIPADIWPALRHRLGVQRHFVVAWLQAACDSFPDRTLIQLLRCNPGLFPSFIHTLEASFSVQVRPAHVVL
jgi:hypothetical protein